MRSSRLTGLETDTVNMTADELEKWLKTGESEGAGWTGGAGGETVGHERLATLRSHHLFLTLNAPR